MNKILIVDDDETTRMLYADELEEEGYDVFTIGDWTMAGFLHYCKLNLEFRTLMPTVSNSAFFCSRKVKHCVCNLQFEISGTQL